jgi:two-component system sensor histidine kinase YesM
MKLKPDDFHKGRGCRMGKLAVRAAQWYGNYKIKHKLFLLILVMMSICFFVTYAALQYAFSIYDREIYDKSSQVLNLSSTTIENELKKIERLSYNIATDSGIQGWLTAINEQAPGYERLKLRAYIVDRLVQYAGDEKYISSIQITDLTANDYTAGQNVTIPADNRRSNEQAAAEAMGGNRWLYADPEDKALIAVREIRSYTNLSLNKLGILTIRVKLANIVEDVTEGTAVRDGELMITSGKQLVYPSGKDMLAASVPTEESGKYGYHIENLNGMRYFFSHMKSGYTDWTYYSLIPFDTIFRQIIWMKRVLLIAFLLGSLLVVVLSTRFARRITMPIEDLIVKMKHVQRGEFRLADPEAGTGIPTHWPMDEVGQLHRTFRIMIQRIEELITENYAKQLMIKETEFKALQAQINPHFMYNTLDSINWLAKVNGQPQISSMVEALGFLLRSSIRFEEPIFTIKQEIDIVMNYITIQRYRFEERLDFQLNIPENVYECAIPKLTLQPLIENAIHHALEQMTSPCRIRIEAAQEDEVLLLIVKDNGPGMEPSRLDRVRRGEAHTQGRGIGLTNIQERIRLAFGDAYGIELDSSIGLGTSVTIRLPYEMRFEHV